MTVFFGNGSGNAMADRRYEMAVAYLRDNDHEAAADLLRQAIELVPAWPPLHFYLGEAHRQAGQMAEAQAAYASYLALDPSDTLGATIKLSLIGAAPAPETMPPAYVAGLFDQYAPRFETSLVEKLGYNTPELIHRAIHAVKPDHRFDAILDLGCGTGLAGALFHKTTQKMTGVDLSSGMVALARARNIYSDLHIGDIGAFLKHSEEMYDLVLSADVFVYIGALEATFDSIASRLSQNGLFAFSVQSPEHTANDWILGDDHRYAHTENYVEHCLQRSQLDTLSVQDVDLRRDGVRIIRGQIYLAHKL